MAVCFLTAFYRDIELITDWREIGLKYLKESFIVDFITTIPTLVTVYRVPILYFLKILRFYHMNRTQRIIRQKISALDGKFNISKQTIYKIDYFMSILVILFVGMHTIACLWLCIGLNVDYSWINNPNASIIVPDDRTSQYITSIYWTVTTLATVGYGDIKGYTTTEYVFNMFVEFAAISFFSFVMGSINNVLMTDTG